FNPPRTPHFKGTVESFFGGLNDQLIASLPGRTFRNWQQRADYKPEDGPLLSYEALLEVIHLYLVDVYAKDKHPTMTCARLEVWEESAAEHPPCLPATPDDLVVLLSKQVQRNLSARGIEVGGMFYSSPEVLALRAELAAKNLSTDDLTVRYNPWDLGTVWVLDPVSRRYLKATAVDSTLQGMTEYQWKVLKRAVRERFDRPEHVLNLAEARNTIRDVVEKSANKPSRKRRVRATRFLRQPKPTVEEIGREDNQWIDVPSTENHIPPSSAAPLRPPADVVEAEEASAGLPKADSVDPSDLDVEDWGVESTGA
ncbi:MAG: Mu transposase C-terminal domain-containing protein, partial [Acidobacteria bacterium]|nr:Mu transposase C-terminal domain-containing protein [Acidobacteriota bacterium]